MWKEIVFMVVVSLLTVVFIDTSIPNSQFGFREMITIVYGSPKGGGEESPLPSEEINKNIVYTPSTETQCQSGVCKLVLYSGIMNYFNGSEYVPVNTRTSISSDPKYDYDMTHAPYSAYFESNINNGEAIKFVKDGYEFVYDLSGGKMQWVEQVGNPTKTKSIGAILSSTAIPIDNSVYYNNAFAYTNLSYLLDNEMFKENFILSSLPIDYTYLYLEYTGEMRFSSNLSMYVDGVFSFFNKQTNLNFDNQLVGFIIGDMPRQAKPINMFRICPARLPP